MSPQKSSILREERTSVRVKISALWASTLFLFAYGDIFGFFKPGQIEDVTAGEVSGIEITPVFLFAVSVYVAIASTMVFLVQVLAPRINQGVNIVLACLYIVSILASVIGETSAYFLLLSGLEIAVLLLVVWYAWTWPRQEGTVVTD